MSEKASITVGQASDGHHELILNGEVNIFVASQLQQEAVRLVESGQNVRVCCEQVDSFDAAALQVLVALSEALVSQGRALQFQGVSQGLLSTIQLAGLAERLTRDPPPLEGPQGVGSEPPSAESAAEQHA
jgi:anti-anti-sigma factor